MFVNRLDGVEKQHGGYEMFQKNAQILFFLLCYIFGRDISKIVKEMLQDLRNDGLRFCVGGCIP